MTGYGGRADGDDSMSKDDLLIPGKAHATQQDQGSNFAYDRYFGSCLDPEISDSQAFTKVKHMEQSPG